MSDTIVAVTTQIQTVEVNEQQIAIPVSQVEVVTAGTQGPAGQGVPAGGTTGRFLKKNSGASYDVSWSAVDLASSSVTGRLSVNNMAALGNSKLWARVSAGSGSAQEVGLGSGLAFNGSSQIVCTVSSQPRHFEVLAEDAGVYVQSSSDLLQQYFVSDVQVNQMMVIEAAGYLDPINSVAFFINSEDAGLWITQDISIRRCAWYARIFMSPNYQDNTTISGFYTLEDFSGESEQRMFYSSDGSEFNPNTIDLTGGASIDVYAEVPAASAEAAMEYINISKRLIS